MPAQIDEMSRVIGNIEAKLGAHTSETLRQFNTVTEQLNKIVSNMSSLPPSPVCEQRHNELRADVAELKKSVSIMSLKIGFGTSILIVGVNWVLAKMGLPSIGG